ncbi:BCOR [Mytilus edulis]|uniref:BCOR n=1 Tax=Mytilus edulis TaxID=6550 RepID=A0A8S3QAG6_MYTED|nr:BCOR [Mytilus edulis]
MQNACKNTQLKILKILLSVVDHQKLNLIDTVKSVCVIEKIQLLKFFLNKVDHRLYDVNYVMKESCKFGWINIVTWLLDNVEYSSLNVQSATNVVLYRDFEGPDKTLLKLLLNYPIHDKVDAAKIIQECCWWDMLDLVKWIWAKVDHKRLDINAAMITACSRNHFEIVNWMLLNVNNNLFDIPYALSTAINADKDDLNISLIQLLLGKTDHNLIDMAALLQLGCEQCWYDVVEWVFGNANPSVLDIEKAMNKVYIQWKYNGNIEDFYKDKTIDYRRRNTEPLVKLILEKGNHNPIDLRKVLKQGCRYGSLDVVTLVLKNSDHYRLNIQETVHILFIECDRVFQEHSNEINDDNRKKETKNTDHALLDLAEAMDTVFSSWFFDNEQKVFNDTWKIYLDVTTLEVKRTDHTMLSIAKAMQIINSWINKDTYNDKQEINNGRVKYELLIKLILAKTNIYPVDLKEEFNQACRCGSVDVVKLVLESIDKKG